MKWPLIGFIGVSAALLLPILLHPHLPLVDLPNHIARLYIAANPDTALGQYYDYTLGLTPNSAVDWLWLGLGRYFWSAEGFVNFMIGFYVVSFLASLMALSRVLHGRWSLWPLAGGLLVYNEVFFWGFQNYLVTVPFAIFALALWLALEGRGHALRIAIFTPIALLLYYMHPFGFALFMFTTFGRELHRVVLAGRAWAKTLLANAALALPFLLPLGIQLIASRQNPENLFGNITRYGSLSQRLEALTSPFTVITGDSATLQISGYLILYLFIALLVFARRRIGSRLRMNAKLAGPLWMLLLVSAIIPANLNGVAFVQIRFPFVVLALFIAATSWVGLKPKFAAALLIGLASLGLFRVILIEGLVARHSQEIEQLATVLEAVPAGALLLPVTARPNGADQRRWHIQAYGVPIANAFVPTLFLGAHALSLKPQWQDRALAQGFSLSWQTLRNPPPPDPRQSALNNLTLLQNWQQKFTHLLVLTPLPEGALEGYPLGLIRQEGGISLYKIKP